MFKIVKTISDLLSGKASIFIILVAIVSFFYHVIFAWVNEKILTNVFELFSFTFDVQSNILGIIMLTMGLTLTPDDFKVLAKRPGDILIGAVAQFTIMPLVAYTLTFIFKQIPALSNCADELAIGIILVGCCPGGVSSNIMSFLCHGDVAYSVGMTCASTLLAPFLTPLLVLWLAGEKVNVDAMGMFQKILAVTIMPIAIGFCLNLWLGHKNVFKKIQGCMPGLSVLCLACIVGGAVSEAHDKLIENGFIIFILTFCMVFCHNTIGYALGYAVGRIFHFNTAKKRTISIEVGMQNAGLGTNLAKNFFVATNPMALVPCAISCVWHSISGTILANIFASFDKKHQPSAANC